MRKYYLSFVDLSEVINVTANPDQISWALDQLRKSYFIDNLNEPNRIQIGNFAASIFPSFFDKLSIRIAHWQGGILSVHQTLHKLMDMEDYIGRYLYLVVMYGFLMWKTPDHLQLLAANPPALQCYMEAFLELFDNALREREAKTENVP